MASSVYCPVPSLHGLSLHSPVHGLSGQQRAYCLCDLCQMTFTKLSLLTAVFLALDYRMNPSRLKLLGIWLALLFSISSYEAGYAMIADRPAPVVAPTAVGSGAMSI